MKQAFIVWDIRDNKVMNTSLNNNNNGKENEAI
jgi:hypothetical protein